MNKSYRLLENHGHLFITTCTNSLAVDHVYLYESVEQIRNHINQARFRIISDLQLFVDKNRKEIENDKPEINYAAMLEKR